MIVFWKWSQEFVQTFSTWISPTLSCQIKASIIWLVSQRKNQGHPDIPGKEPLLWIISPYYFPYGICKSGHPYITSVYFWPFWTPSTHLISINTVLNVSKTGHSLDPPTHSFCWRNIGMVPKHSFTEHWNFLKVCNVFWSKLQGLFFTFHTIIF